MWPPPVPSLGSASPSGGTATASCAADAGDASSADSIAGAGGASSAKSSSGAGNAASAGSALGAEDAHSTGGAWSSVAIAAMALALAPEQLGASDDMAALRAVDKALAKDSSSSVAHQFPIH